MSTRRGGFDKSKPLREMSAVEQENAWDALLDFETGDVEYDALLARERRTARKIAHLTDEMVALRGELQHKGTPAPKRDQLQRRLVALTQQSAKLERQAEELQEQMAHLAHSE